MNKNIFAWRCLFVIAGAILSLACMAGTPPPNTIIGPAEVTLGSQHTYRLGTPSGGQTVSWSVPCGAIVNDYTDSVVILFNSSDCVNDPTHRIGVFVGGVKTVKYVLVLPASAPLDPGQINGGNQLITYNTVPSTLTCTSPQNGDCGFYAYQWQYSLDGILFLDIELENTASLAFDETLTEKTWFRRKVLCNTDSAYTPAIYINVTIPFSGGVITSGNQTIAPNTAPASITATAMANCMEQLSGYLWEISADSYSFSTIPGSGTQNLTYSTPLSSDRYFRRKAICGTEFRYTNTILIRVNTPASASPPPVTLPPPTSIDSMIAVGGVNLSTLLNIPKDSLANNRRPQYTPLATMDSIALAEQQLAGFQYGVIDSATLASVDTMALHDNNELRITNLGPLSEIVDSTRVFIPFLDDNVIQLYRSTGNYAALDSIIDMTTETSFEELASRIGDSLVQSSVPEEQRINPYIYNLLGYTRSVVINGSTLVENGQTEHYVATFYYPVGNPANIKWDVEGGDIVAQNTNPANGPIYIDIIWRRAYGSPHLGIMDIPSRQYGILNIFMYSVACNAYPVTQNVYYGQVPAKLLTSLCNSALGGATYTYQWQVLDVYGANNWTDIAGATAVTYQPPAFTSVWRMYRMITKVYVLGSLIETKATTAASVQLMPLDAGRISATVYDIPYNTSPATVSQIAASGGYTSPGYVYSYTWEYAVNNGAWQQFGTGASFPALNIQYSNTKVRRKTVITGINTSGLPLTLWTAYTNELAFYVFYQSADYENRNYTRENLVQVRGIMTWESADQLTTDKKVQSTTYYDGLSRPVQVVGKGIHYDEQTSQWWDMVKVISYETGGNVEKSFLPYPTTSNIGKFKANATADQAAYYLSKFGDSNPFAKADYDNSPMNQVKKTYAPGNNWAGNNKGVTGEIVLYTASDNIRRWKIGHNAGDQPFVSGMYSAQTIIKTRGVDEDGNEFFLFTNRNGQVVAKKVRYRPDEYTECGGDNDCYDYYHYLITYYIYNDFGELRFIIPPKAVTEMIYAVNPFTVTPAISNGLCFQYEYDELGRVIAKKTPGKDIEYFVYDKRSRIVFTQDGNLRNITHDDHQWYVTLYDDLNRQVATGLYFTQNTRDQLQSYAETASGLITVNTTNGGNINIWGCPLPSTDINNTSLFTQLGFSYYDTYSYTGVKSINTSVQLSYQGGDVESRDKTNRTKGMTTGTKVKVLDNAVPGLPAYLVSTVYYDEEGRLVQSLGDNIKTGVDITSCQYHFAGRVISRHTIHSATGTSYSSFPILTKYKYDKVGRLVGIAKKVNDNTRSYVSSTSIPGSTEDNDAGYKTIATYKYNEIGRRVKKTLSPAYNSGQGLETIDYDYNIRGWLTGINKNYALGEYTNSQWEHYFGMYIGYDNNDSKFTTAQYNGNITGIMWKSQGDNTPRKFDYEYDKAGRLTAAVFKQRGNSSESWNNTKYNFSGDFEYDHNGNITALHQVGVLPGSANPVQVDYLGYSYSPYSNQLTKVSDITAAHNGKLGDFKDGNNGAFNDYAYDHNGNTTMDKNRGIEYIEYNYLNKTSVITITDKGTIIYIYSAGGSKLQKIVTDNTQVAGGGQTRVTTTTYIGEYVYEQVTIGSTAGATQLQFISHEEGRIRVITPYDNPADPANYIGGGIALPDSKQGVFDYFIKDHLGNVRATITEEINKASDVCTMEIANATVQQHEEAVFGNPVGNEVSGTRFYPPPSGWTSNTTRVSKLVSPGSNVPQIGPNALLRVMAGDKVRAYAEYYYFQNPGNTGGNGNGLTGFIQALGGALSGTRATQLAKDNAIAIAGSLSNTAGLQTLMNNQPANGNASAPRAYLNYIFLDEQFNYVGETSNFIRVSQSGNGAAPLVMSDVKATKNGYVFVYLSNESGEPVYFDNFSVGHERGQLLQEDHYYPYGLRIAGISSKALSSSFNTKMTGYGYQGSFSEEVIDFELNYNEFFLRTYDPQTGRWTGADPFDEFSSPYVGMGNNPVSNVDPSGGSIFDGVGAMIGMGVGFGVGVYMAFKTDNPIWVPGMMLAGGLAGAGVGMMSLQTASITASSLAIGGAIGVSTLNGMMLSSGLLNLSINALPQFEQYTQDYVFTLGEWDYKYEQQYKTLIGDGTSNVKLSPSLAREYGLKPETEKRFESPVAKARFVITATVEDCKVKLSNSTTSVDESEMNGHDAKIVSSSNMQVSESDPSKGLLNIFIYVGTDAEKVTIGLGKGSLSIERDIEIKEASSMYVRATVEVSAEVGPDGNVQFKFEQPQNLEFKYFENLDIREFKGDWKNLWFDGPAIKSGDYYYQLQPEGTIKKAVMKMP